MTNLLKLETDDLLLLETGDSLLLEATASIRARLMADVKTALDLIDGTGAYRNDLVGNGGAQYWAGGGISLQSVPTAVLYWLTDTSSDEPVGYVTHFLDVIVDVFTRDSTDPSSAEVLESLLADVERAVLTDPARSGITPNVDTKHVQSTPFPSQEDSPAIGGSVRFRLIYKHIRAEPDNTGA